MTLRGFFTLIFNSFLLIMAFGTEIREFLIAAICMNSLWLYSLISALLSVLSLKFSVLVENPRHFRDEKAKLQININGIAFLPIICKFKIRTADKGEILHSTPLNHSLFLWGLNRNWTYNFSFSSAHTGLWQLGIDKLKVSDIFGMFSFSLIKTLKKNNTVTLKVLPKSHIQYNENDFIQANKGYIGASLENSETGELLSDNRSYQYGDALKRINWKQSVRTGKFFTKLFEKPQEPKTIILMDNCCLNDTGKLGDIYRETALFLAEHFILKDGTITLITPHENNSSQHLKRSFTPSTIEKIADFLAEIPLNKSLFPLKIQSFETPSFSDAERIFIITSNPSCELFYAVSNIKTRKTEANCIVPVCDETELGIETTAVKIIGESPVFISSPEEISQKVGEIL